MKSNRDLELLYEVGCLRFIPRAWRQFFLPQAANLAEHHFRVAWIALLLAKMERNTNEAKILKMALCHDLSESRTGDVHHISRQYTKRDENKAVADIFKNTIFGDEMATLWREYEDRETPEAQIVKDADWLDVDLELQELRAVGVGHTDQWMQQRKIAYKHLHTKSAKKLWQEIKKSSPVVWHTKARSRYTEGDMSKKKRK